MTTILHLDKVPTGINPLTNFGRTAYTGALAVGVATDLHINTAAKIGIDLHDVIGNPATPLIPGKKARYDAQVVAKKRVCRQTPGDHRWPQVLPPGDQPAPPDPRRPLEHGVAGGGLPPADPGGAAATGVDALRVAQLLPGKRRT